MAIWITITPEDLNDYQVAKVMSVARTKALAAGQADPFDVVMPDVVNAMRDDIAENPKNHLSATPLTVPPSLRGVACLLTIEALLPRVPGLAEIAEALGPLIKDAKARMLRVSKGKPVENPDDPIAVSDIPSGGMIETAQEGNSGNSREELSRL